MASSIKVHVHCAIYGIAICLGHHFSFDIAYWMSSQMLKMGARRKLAKGRIVPGVCRGCERLSSPEAVNILKSLHLNFQCTKL